MDAELIIILVAVGISIISGISKAKKKKAENEQDHSGQGQHTQEDDPWATIRKYIEDARDEGQEAEEIIPAPVKHTSYQAARVPEPAIADKNPYTASLNEYAARKAAASNPKNHNTGKKGREELAPTPDIILDTSDLMEDFDLRKAVIYSEILKPKYEEI